jgi:hypothetical protein
MKHYGFGFTKKRRKETPISGPIIKEKALVLIRKMGGSNEEYTASEGWLNKWKKQYGIHQMVISGERLSADHIVAKNFIKHLKC